MRDLAPATNEKRSRGRDPALLIVGHGSRDPRGAKEFHELVSLLRRRDPSLPIEGGFIELSRPPISECVERLVAHGSRE
ncbi:MAG: CbiX/SirB N-terminal domain-containing protein, partial [Actinomycetota bacterium]|nr:CbiX/SirB N-terminal domain-containing protein [Actinomycetota bacterium]